MSKYIAINNLLSSINKLHLNKVFDFISHSFFPANSKASNLEYNDHELMDKYTRFYVIDDFDGIPMVIKINYLTGAYQFANGNNNQALKNAYDDSTSMTNDYLRNAFNYHEYQWSQAYYVPEVYLNLLSDGYEVPLAHKDYINLFMYIIEENQLNYQEWLDLLDNIAIESDSNGEVFKQTNKNKVYASKRDGLLPYNNIKDSNITNKITEIINNITDNYVNDKDKMVVWYLPMVIKHLNIMQATKILDNLNNNLDEIVNSCVDRTMIIMDYCNSDFMYQTIHLTLQRILIIARNDIRSQLMNQIKMSQQNLTIDEYKLLDNNIDDNAIKQQIRPNLLISLSSFNLE